MMKSEIRNGGTPMTNPAALDCLNYAPINAAAFRQSRCGIISLIAGASATLLHLGNACFWHLVAVPALTGFITVPSLPARMSLVVDAAALLTAALLVVSVIWGIAGFIQKPRRRTAAILGLVLAFVPVLMQPVDPFLFR